jgi:hypothetical protein
MPSFLFPNGTFYADNNVAPLMAAPASGAVISMTGPSLYLTPLATLATLTIKLPMSPKIGQQAIIMSSAAVTALTVQTSAGAAIPGSPTALVANTKVIMQFMGGATGWIWAK